MSSVAKTAVAFVVINVILLSPLIAQNKWEGYEVGLNIGTLIYQGDLTPKAYGYTKSFKPAVGLFVAKPLGDYFAIRANITRGALFADDSKYTKPEWKQLRNFKFSSSVTELNFSAVFNPYGTSEANFRRVSPYVFAGAGIAFLNVERDFSNINTTAFDEKSTAIIGLARDTLNAPPKVVPVVPIGMGLKYALSPNWFLNAEATYRFTNTDYIDGFKFAANPKLRDSYYGLSLCISYKIAGNRYKCPALLR